MDPLLEQFLSEARENLAFIDQNIENINGDDPELLNSVFRAAHTLKGGSGIVGFDSVRDITHYAEDLLDMLRSKELEFADGMIDALYNAFDEVLNLIEAAEESEGIIKSDEAIVKNIIENLNNQMGKTLENEVQWEIPFTLTEDKLNVINLPLNMLNGIDTKKIVFNNAELNEEYTQNENLYAVVFDIDESCMVYGNDPAYALSLLEDKVLGVYSCISDENSKATLSGEEDKEGMLLRTHIVAYIYATYEDILDSLFNFIDELQFLPLDISSLLQINMGDANHKLDSLKELKSVIQNSDLNLIIAEAKKAMSLVGENTLQYAQLQRFLNISGLINEEDVDKLNDFFSNIYKGEVYIGNNPSNTKTKEVNSDSSKISKEIAVEDSKNIELAVKNILRQQHKALDYVNNDDDLQRIIYMIEKVRKYIPSMPDTLLTKNEIQSFLDKELDINELISTEIKQISEVEITKTADEPNVEQENKKSTQEIVNKNNVETKENSKKSIVGKTVKIEQESIDSLMNVVGELLVAKNSLPYLADNVISMTHDVIKREIMEKYIFINRLSEQLQDLIMGMRMLPISYVFDRYPKLVRDISKKLEKKVNLTMEGGETKLDKNMIEMLADPMIHIMRNSLDHGIELPDIREKKGKSVNGNINLKAYAQSDKIIIEIIDDGAGINTDRVVNKVLEKGLMTYEQIDALSENELAELVLLPGLSTVDEITEFSGRGVGMDVVRKSIENFGGSIKIKTQANKGTTIFLSIPMSLAVTSLLHIQMNDIHYGIPMDSVSETVKLQREEIEYLHNEPFVYIRGEVIPLLFIKSMLDENVKTDEPLSIVVLNIKDNMLAVVVNKFLGQLDVVQKPLVGIMEDHPLFSGTALLGNGQIIMSIDPIGLLGISQKLKEDIAVA
ncbi:MAG: chemotaxis protein CheA [Sulfurimonas sp.]|nr:chemotaxis protein CheA [Sulfurimonas sp.]